MEALNRIKHRLAGSSVVRDMSWSFVFKVGSRGLGFLVAAVLARLLGADGYGIYAFALALATTLSLPAQFGLPALLVRETARGMATQQPGVVRGVWVWAGRVVGLLSFLIAAGAAVVLVVNNDGTIDKRTATLIWAVLLVPFASLGNLRGAALRGLHRVLAGQLPEFLLRPGILIVLIGLFVLLSGSLGPSEAMALHVVAAVLAFAIGAWLLWEATPDEVRNAERKFETRLWLRSALPLAFIGGVAVINSQADILMLGVWESSDQIGIYKVATQVATLAAFGLQAVNIVVAPRFATRFARHDLVGLQRLAVGSARLTLGLSMAATVVLVVLGRTLLDLAFGSDFTDAYVPLVIMLVGQLINSATGSVGHLLNMTGNERDSARAVAVSAVFNVVLNLALIPRIGIIGAAIASGIAVSVQNLWFWWKVKQRLGISSTAFSFRGNTQGTSRTYRDEQ